MDRVEFGCHWDRVKLHIRSSELTAVEPGWWLPIHVQMSGGHWKDQSRDIFLSNLENRLRRMMGARISARVSCRTSANRVCSGIKTAFFGGSLGFAALFFASGIPRVQKDILQVRTSFYVTKNCR